MGSQWAAGGLLALAESCAVPPALPIQSIIGPLRIVFSPALQAWVHLPHAGHPPGQAAGRGAIPRPQHRQPLRPRCCQPC